MKVGVMLPTFGPSAAPSVEAAQRAEAAGLHGVFAYSHLWPIGQPGSPALWPFPVLGAVAASTTRIEIGTLVARIGLTPRQVLLGELVTLDAVSGGRFIAGIGTGDKKSRAEHVAYGLPYPPAAERRAELAALAAELVAAGLPVWVGGGGVLTHELARRAGAVVNLWAASSEEVASQAALGPVTWGGRFPPGDPAAAAGRLVELSGAGAQWAVFTWPSGGTSVAAAGSAGRRAEGLAGAVGAVAEAVAMAGVELAA